MSTPPGLEADAPRAREALARAVAESFAARGARVDPAWAKAVATVPRQRFLPGFYLPEDERDEQGLTVWEPVTAALDPDRWLAAAYSDRTLITQFDGAEADWQAPAVRHGGAPTSSSTLPSLALRMWVDAEVQEGQTVLEIGAGTGYSTALACERLGSTAVTSVEVDSRRLEQAAGALHGCGYTPTLAVADGLYGYWPEAPFDRIVAACSFRAVPPVLLAQARPGGKILLTLSGWLYGYARVLLTVADGVTAEGRMLGGTVSFMSARVHATPSFGNPAHWAADLPRTGRTARHSPERITAATEQAFHLRFLVQCAVPHTQMVTVSGTVHLLDVVTGATAALTPADGGWQVRERGPLKLWDRIEAVLTAYDEAGRPGPETFTLRVGCGKQRLLHPGMPALELPTP